MRRSRIRTMLKLLSLLGRPKRPESTAPFSAELFGHLAGLIELFHQTIHVGYRRARTTRDSLPARSVEQARIVPFLARHRGNYRLDLHELALGDLEVLGKRLRQSRHHLQQVVHRSELAHLTHLLEEIVEREAGLEQLRLESFRLVFRIETLGLFN